MSSAREFEAFMQNYQNMVYSTALRLVANEAEAEDIAQEVFLKAFERFDELKVSPTAGGWLKKVATNLSLNHLNRYRSRWRFFSEFFSSTQETEGEEVDFASEQDLSQEVEDHDRHQIVEIALKRLPPAQRVPLVLYHMDGLRYEEIAAALKVSLGKVKTDIFRGREALKRLLQLKLPEEVAQKTDSSGAGHDVVKSATIHARL